nr:VIN3-like protein 1 [Ipomoea batatas]
MIIGIQQSPSKENAEESGAKKPSSSPRDHHPSRKQQRKGEKPVRIPPAAGHCADVKCSNSMDLEERSGLLSLGKLMQLDGSYCCAFVWQSFRNTKVMCSLLCSLGYPRKADEWLEQSISVVHTIARGFHCQQPANFFFEELLTSFVSCLLGIFVILQSLSQFIVRNVSKATSFGTVGLGKTPRKRARCVFPRSQRRKFELDSSKSREGQPRLLEEALVERKTTRLRQRIGVGFLDLKVRDSGKNILRLGMGLKQQGCLDGFLWSRNIENDAVSHDNQRNGVARSHGSGDSQNWIHLTDRRSNSVDSKAQAFSKEKPLANYAEPTRIRQHSDGTDSPIQAHNALSGCLDREHSNTA